MKTLPVYGVVRLDLARQRPPHLTSRIPAPRVQPAMSTWNSVVEHEDHQATDFINKVGPIQPENGMFLTKKSFCKPITMALSTRPASVPRMAIPRRVHQNHTAPPPGKSVGLLQRILNRPTRSKGNGRVPIEEHGNVHLRPHRHRTSGCRCEEHVRRTASTRKKPGSNTFLPLFLPLTSFAGGEGGAWRKSIRPPPVRVLFLGA